MHWPTKLQKVTKPVGWGVKVSKTIIKICNDAAIYHFKYLSSGISAYISVLKLEYVIYVLFLFN